MGQLLAHVYCMHLRIVFRVFKVILFRQFLNFCSDSPIDNFIKVPTTKYPPPLTFKQKVQEDPLNVKSLYQGSKVLLQVTQDKKTCRKTTIYYIFNHAAFVAHQFCVALLSLRFYFCPALLSITARRCINFV